MAIGAKEFIGKRVSGLLVQTLEANLTGRDYADIADNNKISKVAIERVCNGLNKLTDYTSSAFQDACELAFRRNIDRTKEIQKEKSKRINFLLRRGFSSEQAIKAMEQL